MNRFFPAKLSVTLLIAGLATAALAQGSQQVLKAKTDFGMLTLKVNLSDRQVEGFYRDPKAESPPGRVFGELSGRANTVRGVWVQKDSSDHPCMSVRYGSRYWGQVIFAYADSPLPGTAVTGTWGYCDDKPSQPWNGTVID